jgi:carbon storage regulator
MLVLTRKLRQSIMIGHDVEVSVLAVSGDKVRLGISAPRSVPVFRKEIYLEIHGEEAGGAPTQNGAATSGPSSETPPGGADGVSGPPSGQAAERSEPTAAD